jgi:hypothetical protein
MPGPSNHFKSEFSFDDGSATLLTSVQEDRPVTFVLNDAAMTAEKIHEKDVDPVFVTPQLLEARCRNGPLRMISRL